MGGAQANSPKTRFSFAPPVGGNLVVQGPECIQPLLRLLQILLRRLALLERLGVVHVLN